MIYRSRQCKEIRTHMMLHNSMMPRVPGAYTFIDRRSREQYNCVGVAKFLQEDELPS